MFRGHPWVAEDKDDTVGDGILIAGFDDLLISSEMTPLSRLHLSAECSTLPDCNVSSKDIMGVMRESDAIDESACTHEKQVYDKWFASDIDMQNENHPVHHGTRVSGFIDAHGHTCAINQYDLSNPIARRLHRTLESMAIWFIENASRIDPSDHRWKMLVLYIIDEELSQCWCVGYCTLFSFLNPITSMERVRICQMLILPNFSRGGYGTAIMECVCPSAL